MDNNTEKNEKEESLKQYGFGPEVMKRTRVCARCGTETTSDSNYCAVCGARLPKENLFEKYKQRHICCPYCDMVLDSLTEYCPYCGKKLI